MLLKRGVQHGQPVRARIGRTRMAHEAGGQRRAAIGLALGHVDLVAELVDDDVVGRVGLVQRIASCFSSGGQKAPTGIYTGSWPSSFA